ncbi:MAG: class I SAM-dependent methyltransferase, partial [Alphaproteobacteria bacterium]|nr:class I SAM-dependent methyltransferase [Alphaproteobacteria bacterium]
IKDQLGALSGDGRFHMNGAPCTFLDVGGANAIFAHEFRDQRWQPHVVDPSTDGAALCADLDIPYLHGALESSGFGRRFNLVAMTYVLEHLADPSKALRAARQVVAPEGALFVEVPDAACFETRPSEDDIFNSCHLWMFSGADLGRLLWANGFEPVAEERTTSVRGHEALKVLAVPA